MQGSNLRLLNWQMDSLPREPHFITYRIRNITICTGDCARTDQVADQELTA